MKKTKNKNHAVSAKSSKQDSTANKSAHPGKALMTNSTKKEIIEQDALRFKTEVEDTDIINIHQEAIDEDLGRAILSKTTGTKNFSLGSTLLKQAIFANGSLLKKDEEIPNAVSAAMLDIEPKDALEGMLVAQMVAIHNKIMDLIFASSRTDRISFSSNYLNLSNKLMRTFIAQIGALKKYRSGGQQKVVVEHVHVNQGGRAVVGNIDHGGEGDVSKK